MPLIRMSDATYKTIASITIGTFRSTGKRQDDGTWLVPIEQDTWDRIQATRLPGETDTAHPAWLTRGTARMVSAS